MDESLENAYFSWLVSKVVFVENPTPSLSYWNILRELHRTEFVWQLLGDDNRAEDGLELRAEFSLESYSDSQDWTQPGCSVLEMLIALSKRAEFDTDVPAATWFWCFMTNLGLSKYTDAVRLRQDHIQEVLYNLVWRQYAPNGSGGLFPLRDPHHDQTKVEIWYQFCEYTADLEAS